jgi:hypothetical protein
MRFVAEREREATSERTKAAPAAATARRKRGTMRSNKMPRVRHRVCGLALPTALLLIAMGMTGAAAQGTPEARQACTPDAMRLCSDFLSDVSQTTRCMMAKRAQWSPACRAAMGHRTYHRAYRHYRYCTHGRCR